MCMPSPDLAPAVSLSETGRVDTGCSPNACKGWACPRFAGGAIQRCPSALQGGGAVDLPIAVSPAFLDDVLKPYRPDAKYLKSAEITHFRDKTTAPDAAGSSGLVAATGSFTIPKSCYIDDTGHFNAVEFNICYNQLAYVVFGKCLEANILQYLRLEGAGVSFADFKRDQLASMLIVNIESRYYSRMNSDAFRGEIRINRISAAPGAYFCFTSIEFSDLEGVKSRGRVLLAFQPSRP